MASLLLLLLFALVPYSQPVFGRELRRLLHRDWLWLARSGIGLGVGALLFSAYREWFAGISWYELLTDSPGRVATSEVARFAASAMQNVLYGQSVLLVLLIPLVAGGSVAGETQAGTLELVRMTPLNLWQYVVGKYLAQLLVFGSLLFGTLPVVSVLLLFGGTDPVAFAAAFGQTLGILGFGLAMTLACSAMADTPMEGVRSAFLWMVVLSCCYSCIGGVMPYLIPLIVVPLAIAVGALIGESGQVPKRVPNVLIPAVERVQRVPVRRRGTLLPPLDGDALLWKELVYPAGLPLGSGWLRGIHELGVVYFAITLPFGFLMVAFGAEAQSARTLGAAATLWCVWIALVQLGASAAVTISGERQRDTLDGLRLLPMKSTDIVSAKGRASLLRLGYGYIALGGWWLFGMIYGWLHPVGFVMLGLLLAAHCFAVVGVALWVSAHCGRVLGALCGFAVAMMVLWLGVAAVVPFLCESIWSRTFSTQIWWYTVEWQPTNVDAWVACFGVLLNAAFYGVLGLLGWLGAARRVQRDSTA